MKLVIAIVRPEKANDVLEALYRSGLGLDVTQHGEEAGLERPVAQP